MSKRVKTIEVLREARRTISSPRRWTRKVPARDARGRSCPFGAPRAVCFCFAGALDRAIFRRFDRKEEVDGYSDLVFALDTIYGRTADGPYERANARGRCPMACDANWGVWNLNGKGGWCSDGVTDVFRGTEAKARALASRLDSEGRGRHEARPLPEDSRHV